MKAVVLAAGEGTRLRPLTYTRPKHLIPVGGKPILEHLLRALKDAGVSEILIVLHYKADMVKEYFGDGTKLGLKIEYVIQPKVQGTADAASLAEGFTIGSFLMVYGDLLITPGVIKKVMETHEKTKATATLAVVYVEHPERYGVVKVEDSHVTGIIEKPGADMASNRPVNAGIYVFSPEIFEVIKHTAKSPRGEKEITDSIGMLIGEERPISAAQIPREEWLDIGRPWDLLEANARVLSRMGHQVVGSIEEGARLIGPVVVSEGAKVRSGAYIEGPAFIGEGGDIGPNCYIRACTSVGKDARIGNGCEVKNSIIMGGTHVGHLSYMGDSVIGEGCNIGAGTITANLRFDYRTVKMRINEETVDSERTKLGAFIGDGVKTGIGCLIMPGVKIGCNSQIGPNVVVYQDVAPDTILILKQTLEERPLFSSVEGSEKEK